MLQVIGSAVGSIDRINRDVFPPPEETGWDSEEDFDGGLDIIWGITPTLTINGTVNPDFAQIEADPDQLNLNGEELMLQERRPFFRENSAIFIVPDGEYPFYSRRIVDIDQGLRLTGQIAGSDTAMLFVNGKDGRDEDDLFGVFRTQTPLTKDLTISSWLITKYNREPLTDYSNCHDEFCGDVTDDTNWLAGLDGSFRPGNWLFNLHAYKTWYPDNMRTWYTDSPTSETDNFHFKLRYNGEQWMTLTDYTDIGMGYYPELGFVNISRTGNRTLMQYFWASKSFDEDHLLNEIETTNHILVAYPRHDMGHWSVLGCNSYWSVNFDNHLQVEMSGEVYDDRSFYKFNEFSRDETGKIINPTARYYAGTLGEGNNKVRTLDFDLSWSDGGFQGVGMSYFTGYYYFSKVRAMERMGKLVLASNPDRRIVSGSPGEIRSHRDAWLESNGIWEDWSIWIYRAKLMVTFNRNLHVRTIFSGYEDQDRQFDEHSLSLLLSWEFLPGSNLYCVYESNWVPYDFRQDELMGISDWQHGRQVFYIKLSYMLSV